jgi:hypothetical protein
VRAVADGFLVTAALALASVVNHAHCAAIDIIVMSPNALEWRVPMRVNEQSCAARDSSPSTVHWHADDRIAFAR